MSVISNLPGIPYDPQGGGIQGDHNLNVQFTLDPRDHIDEAEHNLSGVTKVPPISMIDDHSLPDVLDQGQLGSCTANGWAGIFATLLLLAGFPQIIISRLQLYYDERAREGSIGEDAGADPRDGAYIMKKRGVGEESLWPYDISKFTQKPSDAVYANAPQHMIGGYTRVLSPHVLQMYLAKKVPVGVGWLVFRGTEISKNGIIPMPAVGEQPLGGHWSFYSGYCYRPDWPGGGYYRLRNSWSKQAGDKGDYYMPFAMQANTSIVSVMWRAALKKAAAEKVG